MKSVLVSARLRFWLEALMEECEGEGEGDCDMSAITLLSSSEKRVLHS